ncbi:MAG: SRPBCC family protein [Myxococcales bacterium]
MALKQPPVVHAQMLIRKPAAEVFEAFVDPAITTRFWFTRSSGRVEEGRTLRWEWEMYGAGTDVTVKAVEPGRRILIAWDEPPNEVEWRFADRADGTTLVSITNAGFSGDDDTVVAKALDSKGGFSLLLAGLKAWLEHGVALNLVADHHPDAHVKR